MVEFSAYFHKQNGRRDLSEVKILISSPTWANHHAIVKRSGINFQNYRYWKAETRGLDLQGMLEDLNNAENGSVVLLHACAHNPTGVDPTEDQWKEILGVMKAKKHLPFFDVAYQGFATGDLDRDGYSVRLFVEAGFTTFISQSYAKNMGLYGERIGCGLVVCSTEKIAAAVKSQLEVISRPMYSNPPIHGAAIARRILMDEKLLEAWKVELKTMAGRIKSMHEMLYDELTKLNTPSPSGDWGHIKSQIGMFSFTGLTKEQVEKIRTPSCVYAEERENQYGRSH